MLPKRNIQFASWQHLIYHSHSIRHIIEEFVYHHPLPPLYVGRIIWHHHQHHQRLRATPSMLKLYSLWNVVCIFYCATIMSIVNKSFQRHMKKKTSAFFLCQPSSFPFGTEEGNIHTNEHTHSHIHSSPFSIYFYWNK